MQHCLEHTLADKKIKIILLTFFIKEVVLTQEGRLQ